MFKFNNISSDEMKVICEEEDNLIPKAALSYEENSNGSFYVSSYANIESSLKLYVMDSSKLSSIYKWLDGEGTLEYKDKVSTAYFFNEIKPQRSATIKTIDVSFKRSPFWYKKADSYIECSNTITNEGNVFSQPLIKIIKGDSDTVDLTINNVRFKYSFPTDESYVIVDCLDCNAYYDGYFRNDNLEIGFEFPKLDPGENQIVTNSGDCQIQVLKKDRWI